MMLRPYQRDGLDAIATSLLHARVNRQLLQKPTGTGKTVTFAQLATWPPIAQWLEQFPVRQRRMLVIAHREELLDQAVEKIRHAHPSWLVSVEQANRRASVHSDCVVASIQTLASGGCARLRQLLEAGMVFRLVVVDEAHHAAAPTYREVLQLLGFLPLAEDGTVESDPAALARWDKVAPQDRLLLGVTATPNRTDAIGLSCVFQSLVYTYPLRQAVKDGWLVDIVPYAIETDTSLDGVRTNRGEFVASSLSEAVNVAPRNAEALAAWRELAENVPTLVFSVDVAHAHSLAQTWRNAGYAAAAISGETPKDTRRQILADFRAGRLVALMNCMVLTEGTDLPMVGCILHAKPTKSATLYEQMTGRGLRPLPPDPVGPERVAHDAAGGDFQKPHCILIDIVDVSRKHSLMTAPTLYGLPVGLLTEGQDLETLAEDYDELLEQHAGFDAEGAFANGQHLTLEQLQKRAELVNIWAIPEVPELGHIAMRWIKVSDELYQLEYPWKEGYERLRVSQDLLGQWTLAARYAPRVEKGQKLDPATVKQMTLAEHQPDAASAVAVAEVFMRDHRGTTYRLKDTGAMWRTRPASDKQKALLTRRRIPFGVGLTMGQASDLLDLASARRSASPHRVH